MTIWVGRYAMVAGEVREHGPWLVDRIRTRDEESVRVLVLAEPVDERSAEFCVEVAEAVAALFGRESLSITGGLLRALEQAHANLAEWNRRSLREHRVAVGVTCVAIRDGTATVAQVGPALAYSLGREGLRRLATAGSRASRPLGGDDPIEPHFTSVPLRDRQLLLLSSRVEREVAPAAIGTALSAGPERALPELFLRTRRVSDMSAVLVAELDLEEEGPPPAALIPVDEGVEGRRVAITAPPGDELARRRLPPRRRVAVGLPTVRRAPRTVGRRSPAERRPPWGRVGMIAGPLVALVALVALAWLVLPGLLREDRAAELNAALTQGAGYLSTANATTDPAQRRAAASSALASAERARAIAPDDGRVADLTAQARALLDVLDAVVEVRDLRGVIMFSGTITAPLRPATVTAGGGWLWLLDGEKGRVFRIATSGGDPVEVYRAGEQYGGVAARDVTAIAWEQATRRLLLLDVGRTLFSIDPAGAARPRAIPLRGAPELRTASAMVAYVGNLYILDPGAGEVWRYLPAGEGFDSERAGLLGGIDLAQATHLAVDGELYLLDAGALRRFRQGREEGKLLAGIDRPVEAPVGLVEDTARGLLYIADRARQRIVVGDRTGPFLRQFRHPSFFDLKGLALAPDGATVYVLTGDGISAFNPLP